MLDDLKHVPFLFLAEFDVDAGSLVKHIYPEPFATEEALADLMLPDGAHLRAEDWTIFHLASPFAKQADSPQTIKDLRQTIPLQQNDAQVESSSLLHVLNLVRTKKDESAKRGARVKALAFCSRHPWIHIFKVRSSTAQRNRYFTEPTVATLARIYDAVNRLDLSHMPDFSRNERILLRYSERTDLFEESIPGLGTLRPSRNGSEVALSEEDWQSTQSHITESPAMPGWGSDAVVGPGQRNGSRSGSRRPSDTSSEISGPADRTREKVKRVRDTHYWDSIIQYEGVQIPLRIPLTSFPEEVGDYSLVSLITTFSVPLAVSNTIHHHLHTNGLATPPIILLFNALITGKRVVFLGNGQAASTVAGHVLAACALVSGGGSLLRGFVERSFPYSHLALLDKHEATPGAIIGVTNPIFEELTSRWDVLCNVETGKITISKDLRPANTQGGRPFSPTSSESSGFLSPTAGTLPFSSSATDSNPRDKGEGRSDCFDMMASIQAHDGEMIVRARFYDYVLRFLRLASKFEEDNLGSTAIGYATRIGSAQQVGSGPYMVDSREFALNAPRIEGWRTTRSYQYYRQDFQKRVEIKAIQGIDVDHQIGRLRYARRIASGESDLLLCTLADAVHDPDQIVELLSMLPVHLDGLLPIALGLFHPHRAARQATARLLTRLDAHPCGRKFVQSLNAFQRAALIRILNESPQER